MTSGSSDEFMFFGGVYQAIPGRLIVGPYSLAEAFIEKPTDFKFAGVPLPEPARRHMISCLLPTSALPVAVAPPVAVNSTPSPQESPRPANGTAAEEPPAKERTVAESKAAVAQTTSAAADFIAQMNARRAQQRSTAGAPGTTTGMPLSFSRQVEKARAKRAEEKGGLKLTAGAPESVVRQRARDNDEFSAMAAAGLGADRFLQCAMTQDSLSDTHDVQEAADFIAKTLSTDPTAVIYVFSGSGRNRASALAMYYLQRRGALAMADILPRLPTSTPQVSYLTDLIAADKQAHGTPAGDASFDEPGYFLSYFGRRYPGKDQSIIKAAVETMPGNYPAMAKLLHDQFVFDSSSEQSASRTAPRVYGGMGGGGGGSTSGSFASAPSLSTLDQSFVSNSNWTDDGNPVTLTELDSEIIRSLCKALQSSGVPAGEEAVTDSYVRHRRNRHRVFREFLAKDGVQAAGDPQSYTTTPANSVHRNRN